jgi:protein-tyrosine-phosphatase/DNA-binding HxlR family transcriptional regulator
MMARTSLSELVRVLGMVGVSAVIVNQPRSSDLPVGRRAHREFISNSIESIYIELYSGLMYPPASVVQPSVVQRAAVYAALGDSVRLQLLDDLVLSDRAPTELARRHGLSSNLLAHHLDVAESAGVISRGVSAGDGRRRYVRLTSTGAQAIRLWQDQSQSVPSEMMFLCTHNSARSQLAAALWTARSGKPARSAGTHPSAAVHHMAVAAGQRYGLDLGTRQPHMILPEHLEGPGLQVVTVCDRVHEDLTPDPEWWHWSIADPVEAGTPEAFDAVVAELDFRISLFLQIADQNSDQLKEAR